MRLDWDAWEITCPSCGAVQGDLWDHDWGTRDEIETDCGSCCKPYVLLRSISVDYAAAQAPGKTTGDGKP